MANNGESSSAPPNSSEDDKPVVVRVKRKVSQSLLDAFWLEINERPLKRPLLDFENLSISESSGKEQFKTKKVLVQLVETISSYEATIDVVQSFVASNSPVASDGKTKDEERRHSFKGNQRQDQLLSKARHEHEVLAKYARFEQIWRSRRGKKEAMHDKALDEMCRVYDVVRVDVEERSRKTQQEDISSEDHRLLSSYLPLLREFIPSAASEIESDLHASISKQDDYVYDLYTVNDAMDIIHQDGLNPFPLVQVDDEDFYDGPDDSDFETDDSNAEDNPLNDYPDEISEEEVEGEDEEEAEGEGEGEGKEEVEEDSEASDNQLEESESNKTLESADLVQNGLLDDSELYYGNEIYDEYKYDAADDFDSDDDAGGDGENWKWSYR